MQSALTKVEGVSKAVVTKPDKAVVTASADVDPKDLIKAVKEAGFKARVKQ